MKTQTTGSSGRGHEVRDIASESLRGAQGHAWGAFGANRKNGRAADCGSSAKPPHDGSYTWIKGKVEGKYIYGERDSDGYYRYEVRYDAGPGDLAWMEERDRNYLTRILKEGRLRELEPAVWYWWNEGGGPAINIAEWWSQKLKLPDLDDRLKRAEAAAAELKRTGGEAAWDKAARDKAEREAREREERALAEAERKRFEQAESLRRAHKQEERERTEREAREREEQAREEKEQARAEAEQKRREQEEAKARQRAHERAVQNLLEECRCPLSHRLMLDPVMAADGETYEREEIERWFEGHNTSPKTKAILPSKNLIPNNLVRRQVSYYLDTHPELWETDEVYFSRRLVESLVRAVQAGNTDEVARIVNLDKRLLTRPLNEARQHVLALALTTRNPGVTQAVLTALGARLNSLPEMAADKGVGFFRTAAHYQGPPGARLIAQALKWGKAEIQAEFDRAIEEDDDLARVGVCLDLGADIDADKDGLKPLHRAIQAKQRQMLDLLLERGANPELTHQEGDTALLQAVRLQNQPAVGALLRRRVNPEAKDHEGYTALHLALAVNDPALVQRLLTANTNIETPRPPKGDTALLQVIRANQPELLTLLLNHRVKPNLEATDREGNTPLHLAFNLGHLDLVIPLVSAGADLEKPDKGGLTALLRAVQAKRQDLVQLMLDRPERPADLRATNRAHEGALHLATQLGDTEQDHALALFLLDRGVDGLALNGQGKNAREVAFAAGNLKMASTIDGKILDLRIQNLGVASSIHLPRPVIAGPRQEDTIEFRDLTYGAHLGAGTFSQVFQGTWKGRPVAIKELLAPGLSVQAAEELGREATIMRQLRHPNILPLWGVCIEPGHYSLVLEYVPKGSLYQVLHSEEPLGWPARWAIALGTARGVAHLHDHKPQILHRDLKSLNVLLDERLVPKITDFGLSRVRTETQTTMRTGAAAGAAAAADGPAQSSTNNPGTIAWMAPELLRPNATYGRACDIYSLGLILWELTTRRAPWETARTVALIALWVAQSEREEIPRDTPPSYAKLITQCWAQRPEERPRISEVVEILETHRNEVHPVNIPESFICPITSDIMKNPVVDREGHSFEKEAIEPWVREHHNCPVSRARLELDDLAPNRALRETIEEFLQANPAVKEQEDPGGSASKARA